ncbi:MAG: hypothetical protein ABI618_14145, partial [Nitrospirota bacterium]
MAHTGHKAGTARTTQSSSEENVIVIKNFGKKFGFSLPAQNALRDGGDTELLRSELFSIEQLKR